VRDAQPRLLYRHLRATPDFGCGWPRLAFLRFFAADPGWRTARRRAISEWRSLWGGLAKVLGVPQLVCCGRKIFTAKLFRNEQFDRFVWLKA